LKTPANKNAIERKAIIPTRYFKIFIIFRFDYLK